MNDQASSVYSRRDYERKYREANREKIRENKRRWRERQKAMKEEGDADNADDPGYGIPNEPYPDNI